MCLRLPVFILSLVLGLLWSMTAIDISLADTDTRAVTRPQPGGTTFKRLSGQNPLTFNLSAHDCVLPGEVIRLSGDDLELLADYHLVLRTEKQFVALRQLSISKQQLLLQVPRDTALKRGQRYRLHLLASKGADVSQKTDLSLRLCPTISNVALLSKREAHESGEILVLASSGLVDQIVYEGAKLGYLLLRRYQLDSINQTLLVLGGSDKKLTATIKKLGATFADAKVDFNHLYHTAAKTTAQDVARQIAWPTGGPCHSQHHRVTIGMLDGEIDLAHPALVAKSIKTRQFLLPSQQADNEHGTAIAVLLVGHRPEQGFQGLVPFVDLKAAGVVRQDNDGNLASAEAVTRALDWFINEKVQLVNVSLTSPNANRIAGYMFSEATRLGLVVFAAAGNDRQRFGPSYPAALPGVIAITAVDAGGKLLNGASEGDYIDFAAPGVAFWTLSPHAEREYRSGTSLAVPYAVSIAALYLGQQDSLSADRLFENMQFNAVDLGSQGYDQQYGWGQLQVNEQLCQH